MSALTDLCERWWQARLAASPVWATLLGEHAHDARLPDPSAGAEAERRADVAALLAEAERVRVEPGEEVVAAMLRATAEDELLVLGEPARGEPSLAVLGCEQMRGDHLLWLKHLPETAYHEPARADALLERLAGAPAHLDAAADRYLEALDLELPPVRRSVERVLSQLDGYLGADLGDDPLVALPGPDGAVAWRGQVEALVRDEVRPALAAFRERLVGEQLPVGRDDAHPGLVHVDASGEVYRRFARSYTSLDIDPDEVHELGVAYVTGPLAQEWSRLGATTLGEADPLALMDRMRDEPSLAYGSEQEMVDHAEAAIVRAGAAMGEWFGRLPRADCRVVPAPPHLAGSGAPAWYLPPAPDGSRPGQYFVDNLGASAMLRSEGEATAFHEAIPGHHLQLAISGELDGVPAFLRHGVQVAYAEGWALYAERLADEMGLYASDHDRLGMLSLDAFRAARLVVDTGLHARGWTRQQAVDWMTRHTPLPPSTVAAEIDRYVAMPGQALAYKLGQLEIRRLRDDAEARLGERFDVRGFHDTVLGSGMVTLPVLGDLVEGWVSRQAG